MSRKRKGERPCRYGGSKHGYASRRLAGMAATRAMEDRGVELRAYHCDCGLWHLTSQVRRRT